MKYLKFKIDIYDWTVYYIEAEKKEDADAVLKKLSILKIGDKTIKSTRDEIDGGHGNGGEHLCNLTLRKSVLLMLPSTNRANRINIIFHEKRHIEDKICNHLGLKGREAPAFIAGYIAEKLIPIL